MSATVITYGRKRTVFTNDELQDMVDNAESYYEADNLPKWLAIKFLATENVSFNTAYAMAIDAIKAAIESNKRVIFNVRSDRPYRA